MENLRFADNLDGEAVVALGLPVPRLVLAGLGAASAWAVAELPLPAVLRVGAAGLLVLTTAILAWGRVQGVSVARWAWLALAYAGRVVAAFGEGQRQWVEADSEVGDRPGPFGQEPGPALVAFLSLGPGVGCTAVCRAVATRLRVEVREIGEGARGRPVRGLWVVADRQVGDRTALVLLDWGSAWRDRARRSQVAGVVLVWDGVELFPGELAGGMAALRRSFPGVELLVTLNRAGSASGLRDQISGAGARLAAAIPVDPRLGQQDATKTAGPEQPSAAGVRALAREVLAASRSW
ncbi:MAG: hypothetical protein WA751_11820 [Candidatus Dormiibacterota bacterium]